MRNDRYLRLRMCLHFRGNFYDFRFAFVHIVSCISGNLEKKYMRVTDEVWFVETC